MKSSSVSINIKNSTVVLCLALFNCVIVQGGSVDEIQTRAVIFFCSFKRGRFGQMYQI